MNARLKNALASSAIAAAALLGAASPAQAIVYVGNFDPAFGAPFTDLGWRGTAEFVIPDACAGKTGKFQNLSFDDACGRLGFYMPNARVEFYSLADPLKTLETLDFGLLAFVNSITLITPTGAASPTKLTGVTTAYSIGRPGTSTPAKIFTPGNLVGKTFNFYLKFDGGVASMAYSDNESPIFCTYSPKNCKFSSTNEKDVAKVSFTQVGLVPEPGTFALVLAALGALGLCSRRRSKT